jgi:maltooligosyltrehalose trehalohydrolase
MAARRLPVGAELWPGGVHFRVWAPEHPQVFVIVEHADGRPSAEHRLTPEPDGYHAGLIDSLAAGALYRFRLGDAGVYPDPASRFQPQGPEGPSQIIDPDAFRWTDRGWAGLKLEHQVLYEFHVGTFTPEGTWRAAAAELPRLRDLGITALEMMPVADFAGRYGWGYDGVNLFAPSRLYGQPDDLRFFIDRAHALGLGVLLDVVYNHFGPSGNYIGKFSPRYFSARYQNEWGDPLNFDDDAAAVREFMAANAAYWIREFHFDGLRLDATQQIFDATPRHVVADITAAARQAAGARSILVVGENEPQEPRLLAPVAHGGCGLDALWNDDFHHTAVVALTGRREAYYSDYAGSPQEFISAAKRGFLYQGQRYAWQKKGRGGPTRGLSPRRFITFLENHDQVANAPSGHGERLWQVSQPALYRAMTALWLLSPGTPMFFQGQERGSAQPFMFFADHRGALGDAVRRGRADFMAQFRSAAARDLIADLPDPAGDTFERCRAGDEGRPELVRLHRDLLALRKADPIFHDAAELPFDGAVLSEQAFALRWFADAREGRLPADRLVIVNFGLDLRLPGVPEPLLAPVAGAAWQLLWSSEDPAYGGQGTAAIDTDEGWRIPGRATVVLAPAAAVASS